MAAPNEDLGLIISDLEEDAQVPAKRRPLPVKPTVEKLTSALYEDGVLPPELARLIALLASRNQLDQASLGAIVRNLYPAAKVPSTVVLRVIGSLGHGELKPSLTLQSLLLRWLVMVYPVLEDPGVLSQAYAVLFNLLDTAAIRPQLCQLLALITRRRHVRPFRIQAILQLVRQTGSDQSLVGLLRVFKNYYPEIIVGEVTRGRASAFKHPDPQWQERLDQIQRDHVSRKRESQEKSRDGFTVVRDSDKLSKGRGSHALPTVKTLHAQEDSVTLEEVHNADLLVANLEKLELPSQLVAVLADPLLQKLLLLRPDGEAQTRVSNWLAGCLEDVSMGDADQSALLDIAEMVRDYAAAVKNLPPLLLAFFKELFLVWNGVDQRGVILEALTYTPLVDFNNLYQSVLQPLEAAILDNSPESQITLLRFYTSLLYRWQIIAQSAPELTSLPMGAITNLVKQVTDLALVVSQTSPNLVGFSAIADFYARYSIILSDSDILSEVDVIIPPQPLVYTLYFNSSLAIVSRLCGSLARYKRAFESLMPPADPLRPLTLEEREAVNIFNGFLMDLCNCLIRLRAFSTQEPNARGCGISEATRRALAMYITRIDAEFSLEIIFDISHAPLLAYRAITYVRELEDAELDLPQGDLRRRHAGPITQESLAELAKRGGLNLGWQAYRSGVLEYLEVEGFRGLSDMFFSTMKSLRKEKGKP